LSKDSNLEDFKITPSRFKHIKGRYHIGPKVDPRSSFQKLTGYLFND
jgi:hypothetical protein